MSELPDWLTPPAWVGPVALIALGVGIVVLAWCAIDAWVEAGIRHHQQVALTSPQYAPEFEAVAHRWHGHATWDDEVEATVQQAEGYLADMPFDWRETGI